MLGLAEGAAGGASSGGVGWSRSQVARLGPKRVFQARAAWQA